MKIAALITVAALACGTAFAGQTSADTGKNSTTAATTQTESKGEGFAVKTKRAFHRMGEKLRSIGNKDKDTQQARKESDTRAMGAGPDTQDGGRRDRMDSAYSSWKGKQEKQQK